MKILQAAAEAVPFCKTGGLADVVGALSLRFGLGGHDVCLFLPKHRSIQSAQIAGGMSIPLTVPLGGESVRIQLRYAQWKAVSVYFVDHPESFDRDGLYGEDGKDYPDNDRRFLIFCRAVLEGVRCLGFKPDAVHLHDWQTAPIASYLKRHYRDDPFFQSPATVLTVHNLAYQGLFPKESFTLSGFPESDWSPESMEHHGRFGFLKAGLRHADIITTVSPTYAREIQTAEGGMGLDGVLAARHSDVHGILNGLDNELWNPQSDIHLAKKYSIANQKPGKAACKSDLQSRCGLEAKPDVPLVGIVSRLDRQKGLDLAIEALRKRTGAVQAVLLGVGDPALSGAWDGFAKENRSSVFFRSDFDEPLAHRIYAGADIFLMPSRFEPCGLGQMIAMRYGAVPVVSRTGGLADTVYEGDPAVDDRAVLRKAPTGFLAKPEDVEELGRAIDRAVEAYSSGDPWQQRVSSGMESDFSWDRSASVYLDLYRRGRHLESRKDR